MEGFVDTSAAYPHVYVIRLPDGEKAADYDWLEVETAARQGTYVLSDGSDDPQRGIGFKTLEGGAPTIRIPIAACSQWHGYERNRLYLLADSPGEVRAVRLFRSTGGA